MKKVLLIIVDACASRVFVPAIQNGRLPHLRALARVGSLSPACTSIFPSLTPAATASIITGQYPNKHGVIGLHWYDLAKDEVIYYGDDFWVLLNQGFGNFFDNLLVGLNHQRLQEDTLFQTIERSQLEAACLNFLIFRGDKQHDANVPLLLSLLPGVSHSEKIHGPSMMYFGDLVESKIDPNGEMLKRVGGPFHRFGFEDDNTANLLIQLAEKRAVPDFTVAYFPDNDFESHKTGPEDAVTTLQHLDNKLGQLFEVYGGLDAMLDEFCIILTGDHSQADMLEDHEEAGIRLDEILNDFVIAKAGKPWQDDDQLIVCPEMRSAQIYLRHPSPRQLEHVVALLLADRRVDQVMWHAEELNEAEQGYYIAALDRGRLRFWPGLEGPQTAMDQYGCHWSWVGDLRAVDGQVSIDRSIVFPTYPNAFERIAGALEGKNSAQIWVTARPGHEFCIAETNVHTGGGSHGSLHSLDSTSPLLVAGAPANVTIPAHPRIVDVAPLCLATLGLQPEPAIGQTRIHTLAYQ